MRLAALLLIIAGCAWGQQPVAGSDPCFGSAKLTANINLTASGQVITGTASKTTYICSIDIVTATAQNIALVEGTVTTCGTGTAGMAGVAELTFL